MRRGFIQTLANRDLDNTPLVQYASHELHKINLVYPESVGTLNKLNVLDLVNTLSRQNIAPKEQKEVARAFYDSVKGKCEVLQQLPEDIQYIVKSLMRIFTEQNHSDLSAPVASKMFEKIVCSERV
ncbi:MAG: hypothetical protein PHC34_00165 [Candidatus Gastranaerophilales bacterium]|nr:hypothetical protein [Candidatus Gastranaerophilales bacterium]